MTHINLLPWRELERKEREREFYSIAGGAMILMLLVIVYIHFHMTGLIETQNGRNGYLGDEIKKVEGQIKTIKGLEAEKAQLLARMKVIEELQGQRPLMVHLFDELVKTVPEGIYLTSIKQNGSTVMLEGIAQSNARVSAFMRNIDASQWLTDPKLGVIQAVDKKDEKGSQFSLTLKEVMEGGEDAANPDATVTSAKSKAAPKKGKAGK
jgi:type IV pilus assembly protein PilN